MEEKIDARSVLTDILGQMSLNKAPALCQLDDQEWEDPKVYARFEYASAHRFKSNYLPPNGGSEPARWIKGE